MNSTQNDGRQLLALLLSVSDSMQMAPPTVTCPV